MVAGMVSRCASLDARKRRDPTTSSKVAGTPFGCGRTSTGFNTPRCLTLAASSASLASSYWLRGFVLDSEMLARGISCTNEPRLGVSWVVLTAISAFISFSFFLAYQDLPFFRSTIGDWVQQTGKRAA